MSGSLGGISRALLVVFGAFLLAYALVFVGGATDAQVQDSRQKVVKRLAASEGVEVLEVENITFREGETQVAYLVDDRVELGRVLNEGESFTLEVGDPYRGFQPLSD